MAANKLRTTTKSKANSHKPDILMNSEELLNGLFFLNCVYFYFFPFNRILEFSDLRFNPIIKFLLFRDTLERRCCLKLFSEFYCITLSDPPVHLTADVQ